MLLDASALMALLRRESGWDVVQRCLSDETCLISVVQLVEVEGKLVGAGQFTLEAVATALTGLAQVLEVVPFTLEMQRAASFYAARRRPYNLSLGDCLCLGAAQTLDAEVLTGEQAWSGIPDLPITVRLIRTR